MSSWNNYHTAFETTIEHKKCSPTQAFGTFLPGAKHAIQIPLQEEGIFNV